MSAPKKTSTVTLPHRLRERVERKCKRYGLDVPFEFFVRLAVECDLRSLEDPAIRDHIRQEWGNRKGQ